MSKDTEKKELVKIKDQVEGLAVTLRTFKIDSKESFDNAALHLETITRQKKVVTEYWAPLVETAFDAKQKTAKTLREVRDKEEECLSPLDKMDAHVRKLRLTYKTEQDKIDRLAREKAEEVAQKIAKKEADKLLKKAERANDTATEEKLIEKADEVKAAPTFIPKTIKKSERSESGTLNTFVSVIEIEVHDIKSICGMIFNGELSVDCVTVSEAKIKAWAKSFDKPSGMYDGFNINRTEKERITVNI